MIIVSGSDETGSVLAEPVQSVLWSVAVGDQWQKMVKKRRGCAGPSAGHAGAVSQRQEVLS